jgi:hypothetical protein
VDVSLLTVLLIHETSLFIFLETVSKLVFSPKPYHPPFIFRWIDLVIVRGVELHREHHGPALQRGKGLEFFDEGFDGGVAFAFGEVFVTEATGAVCVVDVVPE